jgi:hypothetical protein
MAFHVCFDKHFKRIGACVISNDDYTINVGDLLMIKDPKEEDGDEVVVRVLDTLMQFTDNCEDKSHFYQTSDYCDLIVEIVHECESP